MKENQNKVIIRDEGNGQLIFFSVSFTVIGIPYDLMGKNLMAIEKGMQCKHVLDLKRTSNDY